MVSRLFSFGHIYWEYTHETLVPFEVISSGCNALVLPFQQLLEGPMCCILTFDPADNAIPKTRSCIFHWRRRAWLTIWDRVKIPRYSHRLMHRKRVTCELHDSYFRLMTIKHAIPKFEWVIELLYNSVKTGSQKPDQFGEKLWKRKPAPSRELGPRASGWAILENGKEMLMAIGVEVNMLQFYSVSNSLSLTNLSIK